jgi:hypothetical protein
MFCINIYVPNVKEIILEYIMIYIHLWVWVIFILGYALIAGRDTYSVIIKPIQIIKDIVNSRRCPDCSGGVPIYIMGGTQAVGYIHCGKKSNDNKKDNKSE